MAQWLTWRLYYLIFSGYFAYFSTFLVNIFFFLPAKVFHIFGLSDVLLLLIRSGVDFFGIDFSLLQVSAVNQCLILASNGEITDFKIIFPIFFEAAVSNFFLKLLYLRFSQFSQFFKTSWLAGHGFEPPRRLLHLRC